jgi:hypothetical protein
MPETDTTPAAVVHACDNCEGIDAGSCLMNPDRTEPDNPAATALARHIADHPLSTVLAATRLLGWRLTIRPAVAISGRTETGATTANVQAGDATTDNDLRAGIAKVLGIGSPAITDHDLIEHVRAALIYRFRADQEVLLKDAALTRERERADAAEGIVARVREAMADTIMFGPNASLAVPLTRLRAALAPPADQDRGGQ